MITCIRKLRLVLSCMMVCCLACGSFSNTVVAKENDLEQQESIEMCGILKKIIPASSILLQENLENENTIKVQNEDGTTSVFIFDRKINYNHGKLTLDNLNDTSSTKNSITAITEKVVCSNFPTTNFSNLEYNEVGIDDTRGTSWTLLKFDLSSLSKVDYDDIISARYSTYLNEQENENTVVEAYFLQSSWNANSVTWNTKPTYYETEMICAQNVCKEINFEAQDSSELVNYNQDFYITTAVQGWLQGLPNNGIVLKARDGEGWCKLANNKDSKHPTYLEIRINKDEETTKAAGITSGQNYFILNKKSGMAMSARSLISGDGVLQKELKSTALQTWKLNYISDGYYSITLANTSTCLTCTGNAGTFNAEMQVSPYTGADNQKWRIKRNWDGSYQIISKFSTMAVTVMSGSTAEDAKVCQNIHEVNFIKHDDWTIIPAKKQEVSVIGFSIDSLIDFSTEAYATRVDNLLKGYDYETNKYIDVTSKTGYETLQNSGIWHYTGHGNTSGLFFYTKNQIQSCISCRNINSIENYNVNSLSPFSLNKLQLCTIGACKTGDDDPENDCNLAGILYQRGAHYISSYTKSVDYSDNDLWYWYFYLSLNGKDVLFARNFADIFYYNQYPVGHLGGETNARHELGDSSIRINYANSALEKDQGKIEINCKDLSDGKRKSIEFGNKKLVYYATDANQNVINPMDFYFSDNGDIYAFKKGSNDLRFYVPNINYQLIGNQVVDYNNAKEKALNLIDRLGYNTYNISELEVNCTEDNPQKLQLIYSHAGQDLYKVVVEADDLGVSYITSLEILSE